MLWGGGGGGFFILAIRANGLLDKIPDANATKELVNLIKNAIDSYMDKMLTPIERLQKLCYTVFFLRYWCQWIILHPDYTMENFISYNAYYYLIFFKQTFYCYFFSEF